MWVALDDATEDNGCLMVIKGSQQSGYLWPQSPHNRPDEFDEGPASHGFDDTGAVPVVLRAGDVLYFNGYLLHSSRRNRTQSQTRRALVIHAMNAWSLLPWSNPDVPTTSDADRRAVLTVAGADPYAWKGISVRLPPFPRSLRPSSVAGFAIVKGGCLWLQEHHRTPYLGRTKGTVVPRRGGDP